MKHLVIPAILAVAILAGVRGEARANGNKPGGCCNKDTCGFCFLARNDPANWDHYRWKYICCPPAFWSPYYPKPTMYSGAANYNPALYAPAYAPPAYGVQAQFYAPAYGGYPLPYPGQVFPQATPKPAAPEAIKTVPKQIENKK